MARGKDMGTLEEEDNWVVRYRVEEDSSCTEAHLSKLHRVDRLVRLFASFDIVVEIHLFVHCENQSYLKQTQSNTKFCI